MLAYDFAAAQYAGRDVQITIGPWTHAAVPGMAESLRQSIALFQKTFGITSLTPTKPSVRLFLMAALLDSDYTRPAGGPIRGPFTPY